MNQLEHYLNYIAYHIRIWSLKMTTKAMSGHPTSALSCADILAVLFFYTMRFDPADPTNPYNDQFILSKGHAAPALYAVWHLLGIVSEEQLYSLRTFESVLEGHPTPRFSPIKGATGSLGQGLSMGLGMALNARLEGTHYKTYVLMGDGEVAEGQIWEAMNLAAYYKTSHLVGIIDVNGLGQSTQSIDDYNVQQLACKVESFGWDYCIVDGHDIGKLIRVFDVIATRHCTRPFMIIAVTKKGFGLACVEGLNGFHGKVLSKAELSSALAHMKQRFCAVATPGSYHWKPSLPLATNIKKAPACQLSKPHYPHGAMLAPRQAFGESLMYYGSLYEKIVCLDADVKNSTYSYLFENQFPERFFQCFIAEQNMVSVAVGLQKQGKVPFVSTFGAFFSRAFDQLRMAAISRSALRLCATHVGSSIGADGPSQMALEDIALIKTLPDSIIVYPADAVSTFKLMQGMIEYDAGISYLRMTRAPTAVLYSMDESFIIGGCKVLRHSSHDRACIVAAGITVHEALKAYEQLKSQGIYVAVIDLYSVKPLDVVTLVERARSSNNHIIVVEDHYKAGGIGESIQAALNNYGFTVTSLGITQIPRSGSPEDLFEHEGINARAIVQQLSNHLP